MAADRVSFRKDDVAPEKEISEVPTEHGCQLLYSAVARVEDYLSSVYVIL